MHFPAALLPLAVLVATWALVRRQEDLYAALLLLRLGAGGAVAAALTGWLASRRLAAGPGGLVEVHRNLMISTTIAAIALVVWTRRPDRVKRVPLAIALAALAGLTAVGADRGVLVALRARGGGVSAPVSDAEPYSESPAVGGDRDRGAELYAALRCDSCHGAGAPREVPGVAPSLEAAGSRYHEPWLRSYLLAPYERHWADEDRRPVLRMPDYRLTPADAADLAAWPASRRDPVQFPSATQAMPPFTSAEIGQGRELFVEYSCAGCHSLEGHGTNLGPVLDGAGTWLQPGWVYALLRNPDSVIPGTPMKNFGLWEEQARALTAYIQSLD